MVRNHEIDLEKPSNMMREGGGAVAHQRCVCYTCRSSPRLLQSSPSLLLSGSHDELGGERNEHSSTIKS